MKQCETLYETIFSFRRVKSNQRRHASIYRDGIQVGRQAADEAQFVSLHALHKCATMHARETSHNTLHRLNEFWILRASRVPIVYRTHAFTLFNKHRAFTRPTDSIDFALISYLSILPSPRGIEFFDLRLRSIVNNCFSHFLISLSWLSKFLRPHFK